MISRPATRLAAALLAFFVSGLVLAIAAPRDAASQDAPHFQMPLECEIGVDCWVLRYFDHDSSNGTKDHECGFMTGDDHRGIDIRVRDYVAMHQGITAKARAYDLADRVSTRDCSSPLDWTAHL